MSDDTKLRLSGWCSPNCTPRSHATCQERGNRGQLVKPCECPVGHEKKDAE